MRARAARVDKWPEKLRPEALNGARAAVAKRRRRANNSTHYFPQQPLFWPSVSDERDRERERERVMLHPRDNGQKLFGARTTDAHMGGGEKGGRCRA